MAKLMQAVAFCWEKHKGQPRKYTGEPYFLHPVAVAGMVAEVGGDEDMQIAALLHDTIEDCGVTHSEIAQLFGQRAADLVQMVTDVSTKADGNRAARKQLDLEHIAKASPDGKTIKLADLIHNTTSITKHDAGFAKVYMAEKRALLEVLKEGNADLYDIAQWLVDCYFADMELIYGDGQSHPRGIIPQEDKSNEKS